VCAVAALVLCARAMVAPGLMFAVGEHGITLVLCPLQNRSLSFESDGAARHQHGHHHGAADESADENPHSGAPDSTCELWAGSAGLTVPAIAPIDVPQVVTITLSPRTFFYYLPQTPRNPAQPRAPPRLA